MEGKKSESRLRALDIAYFLFSRYSTKNAIYLLGLASYLGKGADKNWELASVYFGQPKLSANPTVSFYRAMIMLSKSPTAQNKIFAESLIANAVENNVSQALAWVAENTIES